jgi:protein-S-isoprenylcysteine O-methyltransferase Ste14
MSVMNPSYPTPISTGTKTNMGISDLTAIFAVAFGALAALNSLLLLTVFTDVLKLWPTPSRQSWQSYTFWPLFRVGLGLTMLVGVLRFALAPSHEWQAAVGALLALAGLGVTVYGYFELGLENTYGADDGLVTSGLYRYSRNPQYVASMLAFVGLGAAAGSLDAVLLCALAVGVYVLLPLAEEPWLERAYGASYARYRERTPRFLSLAKLLEKPVPARR